MKKLLLLLFLIPNLVIGDSVEEFRCEYDYFNKSGLIRWNNACIDRETYNIRIRNICALSSKEAKSDFSAKKIYYTCLERKGVPK
jgi:hypothetical protein